MHITNRRKISHTKEYWICDTGMAGCTGEFINNNVFKFLWDRDIWLDNYFEVFTTKKEAIEYSNNLDKE